ncbi:MAG TPA: chemotaxis protein CheW [Steroidobacteraceae bacterium]|nr:chemotaxis protein CheW [Steroidobacteraceae bacterium]
MARESSDRFLTFRVDTQLYALRADEVTEVIRPPTLARVPQGPAALLGLANLRGSVLPIASLREMLGKPAAAVTETARAIVLDIGAPIGLMVDCVEALESAASQQVETLQNDLSAAPAEQLLGAFSTHADRRVAKILDIRSMLKVAFANRSRAQSHTHKRLAAAPALAARARNAAKTETLVTFEIAGQEFALPLEAVEEILPAPASVTAVARAEAVVLGVTSVRDTLLPLLSLRALLGFSAATDSNDRQKIVVMRIGGAAVGLVADRARAILAADLEMVDPIPPVLAARTGGESRVRAVYRAEAGRRLISILSPDQLFREDVMKRLAGARQASSTPALQADSGAREEMSFVVFRLGSEEFGLPIDTVVEVAQVPQQITRVPKTPKFLEGVVNLRGEVLPVVDQRRRFEMPKLDNAEGRRLVVIRTERHRAGLIVDSVSEVLRTTADSVEPPPELTDQVSRLVRGVINLPKSNRMVLLLDAAELLTRSEQGLLDSFQAKSKKANE